MNEQICLDFDGKTFDRTQDGSRLHKQLNDVFNLMFDGHWRTLYQIADKTGHPTQSVSARLRDLRKPKFGGYTVNRRCTIPVRGIWEYQLET